jgi:hypothetical protein
MGIDQCKTINNVDETVHYDLDFHLEAVYNCLISSTLNNRLGYFNHHEVSDDHNSGNYQLYPFADHNDLGSCTIDHYIFSSRYDYYHFSIQLYHHRLLQAQRRLLLRRVLRWLEMCEHRRGQKL